MKCSQLYTCISVTLLVCTNTQVHVRLLVSVKGVSRQHAHIYRPLEFPYGTGYFSFRCLKVAMDTEDQTPAREEGSVQDKAAVQLKSLELKDLNRLIMSTCATTP